MIQITEETIKVWHIISEPGDATRYDFMVKQDYDDFIIFSAGSTFKFPQRINRWELDDEIKADCNPSTTRAVIAALKEIQGE